MLLAAAAGPGWSMAAPASGYLEYVETRSSPSSTAPPWRSVTRLWFKRGSYRRELTTNQARTIFVSGPGGDFQILPAAGEALRMPSPPGPPRAFPMHGIPGLPLPDAAAIPHVARKTGTEKVGRYLTEIYESHRSPPQPSFPRGPNAPRWPEITERYWVTWDLPVPVKRETRLSPGGQIITVLQAVRLNIPIPDSMFQLPKGIRIRPPAPGSGYLEYVQTTASPLPHGPPRIVTRLWFKGRYYRWEMTTDRGKIVDLAGPAGSFHLLPGSSEAMQRAGPPRPSVSRAPVYDIPGLMMFPSAAMIPAFTRKVGTGKVGRYRADIYELRMSFPARGPSRLPASRATPRQESITRYWVTHDLPAPVKVEVKPPIGPGSVTTLQTARFNIPIPDSMFQLPRGVRIRPMHSPGGQRLIR
jgi:hypothetical protein